MKALYTNEKECKKQIENDNELGSYNYNSRHQALRNGYKFVHLFETYLDEFDVKTHQYYSTMKL